MSDTYNLYNLEAPFKEYLLPGNQKPVSVKNYMSDFRHFAGWITLYSRSQNVISSVSERSSDRRERNASLDFSASPRNDISNFMNVKAINEYKSYLSENNIPHKTINRRLSTVRKFCSFCISQGWLKENPAKQVTNITHLSSRAKSRDLSQNEVLSQFRSDLEKEKLDQSVITSYLEDVRDFLKV